MELCPDCADPTETFELPPVFLQDYPDLEGLRNTQTRQTALAIYSHNRTIHTLFESLSRGGRIRGLSERSVAAVLDLIETSLRRIGCVCEAFLLTQFITDETALFNDSRSRWFGQER